LEGKLDSSNYTDFIRRAQELFAEGSPNLVIDMRKLDFMSSAGLMALHTVARLFSGTRDGQEETANSYRSIDPQADRTIQQHVKLVGPNARVLSVLEVAGLSQFFQIFDDLDPAIKSFAS
jgi:anti-anti-sigma regulatory factor